MAEILKESASEKGNEAIEKFSFARLRRLYIIAFTAIAVTILVSGLFVQNYLDKQLSDSRVINLAGRQRMLSQKLAKEVLLLSLDSVEVERGRRIEVLRRTLDLWEKTHLGLIHGDKELALPGNNGEEINKIYQRIQPSFEGVVRNSREILRLTDEDPAASQDSFSGRVAEILRHESVFLEGMNAIVFLYDEQAYEKVTFLKRTEIILLIISLSILGFEVAFIFIPTTLEIKKIIGSLIRSEGTAKRNAEEISALYKALQKTHEDLADFSFALDQASVFAKADKTGRIFYISQKFAQLTGYSERELESVPATEFIQSAVHSNDFLVHALNVVKDGGVWHDQVKLISKEKEVVWLDMTILPVVNTKSELIQIIFLCSDITDKKIADEYYRKLDKKKFEKQIKEHRMKSSLVVEGQEDERKRISKDLHDGIGQLLTGLKFQIEALDFKEPEKAGKKLAELKDLVKEIILEVRRISFFLTPGVLEDYGLTPAVNKFVAETRKYTETEVIFNNITGFNNRLDDYKEINLYRIIQEAVNNSIKYAKAGTIKISFFHDAKKLTIIIQDDGMGFVTEEVLNLENKGAVGLGLYNMQERAVYADGKIQIYSKPGEGTKIYLQTPI